MKTVKFLSIIAITFLIGLIYLIVTLENPLDQQYNEIVQKIMDEGAFVSEQNVLSQNPELKELKVQIQDIKKMHYHIQQATRHPIPPDEKQSLYLMNQIKKLKIMKEKLQLQVSQLTKIQDRTLVQY